MVFVRPAADTDLDALLDLAALAGVGLTTLPKDRALMARRISKSVAAFSHLPDRPGGESYLFVMEDPAARRVVGACGIVSKVGGFEPFYGYHIETHRFESQLIHVRKDVPILNLVEEHDGPCEVGSLFLHPDYRHSGNGRLLQRVRFLFIAEHPEMFDSRVISEIRGVLDEHGHSPFWDALGRHFFGIDFAEADRLSVVNKKFIADLFPRHPIYIPLLPESAQQVIGKPHADSARAVKNLEAEGFRFNDMVDIFDAGPVVSCPRDQIRTVRESRRVKVAAIVGQMPDDATEYLIGTTAARFRACRSRVDLDAAGGAKIDRETAAALDVDIATPLRIVAVESPQRLVMPKSV